MGEEKDGKKRNGRGKGGNKKRRERERGREKSRWLKHRRRFTKKRKVAR
jgi:hypothetical protein